MKINAIAFWLCVVSCLASSVLSQEEENNLMVCKPVPASSDGSGCSVTFQKQNDTRLTNVETRLDDLSGSVWKPILKQYHVRTTLSSWQDARTYCQSIGGDLVTSGMRDPQTRKYIIENFVKPAGPEYYWIGLSDLETEGTWKWIDGVASNSLNSDFASGEPNDRGYGTNVDCGHIGHHYSYQMDDHACSRPQRAICERVAP